MNIKVMSTNKIIAETKSLHYSIHVDRCYSLSNMNILCSFVNELNERGYEIKEITTLDIRKPRTGKA